MTLEFHHIGLDMLFILRFLKNKHILLVNAVILRGHWPQTHTFMRHEKSLSFIFLML